MDQEHDLPDLFKRYGVFVLPVDRRSYAIVRGVGYHKPEGIRLERTSVHEATLPVSLVEMSESGPHNEGLYLEHAYNTGLLERFLEVRPLYGYFRGRTTTPNFSFRVGASELLVKGAQMEVDQAYVGGGQVIIAEAKIGVPNSFIIRQLYYPYRKFKIEHPTKNVRTFLFAYDSITKLSSLWQYSFADPSAYESISLIRAERFEFQIKTPEAKEFASHGDLTDLIPQADDLAKIMELPIQVHLGKADSKSIAIFFDFDRRQSSYYRQASEGLGLVRLNGSKYSLTSVGEKFVSLPTPERVRAMTEALFKHPILQEILKTLLSSPGRSVSKQTVEKFISENSRLTGSTVARRAQTIFAWVRWIQRNFGLVVVSGGKIWLATQLPELNRFS